MKKVIYGALFLAIVGIGVVGCKKKQPKISSPNNVEGSSENGLGENFVTKNGLRYSTDNSVLIFNTVADYELSISDLTDAQETAFVQNITALGYTTYAEHIQGGTDLIDDNVLSAILNKDRVVQIGNYLYKVNLQLEKVFVLPLVNKSFYNDLVNENMSNKSIRKFSTSDDVIDLAEANDPGEKCGGISGGEYVSSIVDFGNNIRCQASVKHFAGGVYFRTTARFVPLISGVLTSELEVKGPEAWRKRRPCNSGTIGTSPAGVKASGTTQQLWQFYSGTRNLNGLYLFARVKCTYNGVVKYSSWCGRNVNSPY